jgi:putative alpha-1,2-mannosidase
LKISVENFNEKAIYIESFSLNGKKINRNWITQEEINQGGILKITASENPITNKDFEPWITEIK